MFQFPGFTHLKKVYWPFKPVGCPIRIFADQFLFADPRDFSQLTTSFIVSGSQGILRSLLVSFSFVNHTKIGCLATLNLNIITRLP